MSGSDKSGKGWPDDGREWREFTDLDILQGEWIARDLERRVQEDVDHYDAAHNHGPLKAIADFLVGNEPEECIDPRCDAETFNEQEEASESWWQRWLRGSGDGGEGSSGSSD